MKTVIECVDCGGGGRDGTDWLSIVIAGLALLATLIALGMNYAQFRVFNRELKARARFQITLSVQNGTDGIRWAAPNADTAYVVVAIGIKNVGNKAAGETLINALFPAHIEEARWSKPNGGEIDAKGVPLPAGPDDQVSDPADGSVFDAKYLARTLPRIGTKPNTVAYFKFPVTGLRSLAEARIPIRVKVQADEIPDDIEEYEKSMVVLVKPGPPPS